MLCFFPPFDGYVHLPANNKQTFVFYPKTYVRCIHVFMGLCVLRACACMCMGVRAGYLCMCNFCVHVFRV